MVQRSWDIPKSKHDAGVFMRHRTAGVGSANAVALIPSAAATAHDMRVTIFPALAWEVLPESKPTSARGGVEPAPGR